MRGMTKRSLTGPLAALLLLIAGLVASGVPTASAQYAPCAGGRQVGEANNGGVITPICEYDQAGSGSAPAPGPQMRWATARFAVAWHPDGNDVWAIWDTEDATATVKRDVIAACNRAMGGGCSEAGAGENSSLAIAIDHRGMLLQSWGATRKQAEQAVMKLCAANDGVCTVHRTVTAKPWQTATSAPSRFSDRKKTYFPDRARALPLAAAVAWPATPTASKWQNKIWMVTGVKPASQATVAALARCKADTGVECVVSVSSRAGVLVQYLDPGGTTYWTAAPSAKAASLIVKDGCGRQKCRILATYDAASRRDIVVDLASAAAAP